MPDQSAIPTMDKARALELLREVVAESGAGKTASCVYTACIVGAVLRKHGVGLDLLGEMDEADDAVIDSPDVWPLTSFLQDDARRVLRAAQRVQDQSYPWGDALTAAEIAARP